jgi:hypothetical protein
MSHIFVLPSTFGKTKRLPQTILVQVSNSTEFLAKARLPAVTKQLPAALVLIKAGQDRTVISFSCLGNFCAIF